MESGLAAPVLGQAVSAGFGMGLVFALPGFAVEVKGYTPSLHFHPGLRCLYRPEYPEGLEY